MSAPRTDVASSIKLHRFAAEAEINKRQPASPSKQTPSKKQAKSERKLPPTSTSLVISKALSLLWRKETSAKESSDEVSKKTSQAGDCAKQQPGGESRLSASAPEPARKMTVFTIVGRNGRRICSYCD
ncbi:hypothetical protein TNCV_5097871 [Trichonephila clavipes]|nr:hypothetical protein TNCV_5097871 [Trichonephila clavipes]